SPIHLQYLMQLEIEGLSTDATAWFLRSVDAPNCRTVAVSCDLQYGPINSVFDTSVETLARLMRSILETVDDLIISVSPPRVFGFLAQSTTDRRYLMLRLSNPSNITDLLRGILAFNATISATIKGLRLVARGRSIATDVSVSEEFEVGLA
ncbi:hypothetical protein FRB99_002959, partial [Tulasnella sp. 403]